MAAPSHPHTDTPARTRQSRKGVPLPFHGASGRVPVARFRAMAALYLARVPNATSTTLHRALRAHLAAAHIHYSTSNIIRHLSGTTTTTTPREVEDAMRALCASCCGLADDDAVDAALAAAGSVPPRATAIGPVPAATIRQLVDCWLQCNRGCSERELIAGLRAQTAYPDVAALAVATLQGIFRGVRMTVPRSIAEAIVHALRPHGITSLDDALTRRTAAGDDPRLRRRREREPSVRCRQLAADWQLATGTANHVPLAHEWHERLTGAGVRTNVGYLHRVLVRLQPTSVARFDVAILENIVRDAQATTPRISERSRRTYLDGYQWLRVEPIIALTREWRDAHPDVSIRELSRRVAITARRMKYPTHDQYLLHTFDRRQGLAARVFLYRALLRQFDGRASWQAPRAFVIPRPSAAPHERKPLVSCAVYLQNVRDRITAGTAHPGLIVVAARQAERLYGIPLREAERLLGGAEASTGAPLRGTELRQPPRPPPHVSDAAMAGGNPEPPELADLADDEPITRIPHVVDD